MISEDTFLDLTGVKCPMNFVRAKLLIDTMKKDEILKLQLDLGEALESVTKSLSEEGHDVLETICSEDYAEIFIRKF